MIHGARTFAKAYAIAFAAFTWSMLCVCIGAASMFAAIYSAMPKGVHL
jgi:hypothetical protein